MKNISEISLVANYIVSIFENKPILLIGEIGSGKTTLVKAIGKILKIKDNIKSPSFNKMNIYDNKMIHIDAYNLKESLDIFEDFFYDKIIIVEWANLYEDYFDDYIKVNLSINEEKNHVAEIKKVKGSRI